jgi:hypothetical protein
MHCIKSSTSGTDIVPAHFDTYPLIDVEAAKRMLAAQAAATGRGTQYD